VHIKSRHFGTIEIEEDKTLSFPKGLIGFPAATTFCLIQAPEIQPYQWLHGVNNPDLAFLVLPLALVRPDYQLQLTEADERGLQFQPDDTRLALAIVVANKDPKQATVNLMAPVVVNPRLRLGGQIILEQAGCTTRNLISDLFEQAREGEKNVGTHKEKKSIVDARR
jgi:flagellar assembly factor FliW